MKKQEITVWSRGGVVFVDLMIVIYSVMFLIDYIPLIIEFISKNNNSVLDTIKEETPFESLELPTYLRQ